MESGFFPGKSSTCRVLLQTVLLFSIHCFTEVFNDETTLHVTRNAVQIYCKILVRHIVGHSLGEIFHRLCHDDDRRPLSGTAAVCVIIAAALRNEIERAAVPVPE